MKKKIIIWAVTGACTIIAGVIGGVIFKKKHKSKNPKVVDATYTEAEEEK